MKKIDGTKYYSLKEIFEDNKIEERELDNFNQSLTDNVKLSIKPLHYQEGEVEELLELWRESDIPQILSVATDILDGENKQNTVGTKAKKIKTPWSKHNPKSKQYTVFFTKENKDYLIDFMAKRSKEKNMNYSVNFALDEILNFYKEKNPVR